MTASSYIQCKHCLSNRRWPACSTAARCHCIARTACLVHIPSRCWTATFSQCGGLQPKTTTCALALSCSGNSKQEKTAEALRLLYILTVLARKRPSAKSVAGLGDSCGLCKGAPGTNCRLLQCPWLSHLKRTDYKQGVSRHLVPS